MAPFSRPEALDDRAGFRAVSVSGGAPRTGDRRHQTDCLSVQGLDLFSLPRLLQSKLGERDILSRSLPGNLSGESEEERSRELGRLAAGLSRSLSPRSGRRVAGAGGE